MFPVVLGAGALGVLLLFDLVLFFFLTDLCFGCRSHGAGAKPAS
jgi:hypothetical protein